MYGRAIPSQGQRVDFGRERQSIRVKVPHGSIMKKRAATAENISRGQFEVTSVSSFLALIEREKEVESGNSADFIFRGQQQDHVLIPKIRRLHPKVHDLATLEKLMLDDFERQMLFFTEKEPRDKWDLLALAQHHGLPTRLLDWSFSALTALWFCVERGPARKKNRDMLNGVVWILKTRVDDFVPSDQPGDPFHQERTRIFRPRFVSRRIMAQSGLFTCHKMIRDGDFVAFDKNREYKNRLQKVVIPGFAFSSIREQLGASGATSLSLFPDLDGLAAFLTERYFYDPYELVRRDLMSAGRVRLIDPAEIDKTRTPYRKLTSQDNDND